MRIEAELLATLNHHSVLHFYGVVSEGMDIILVTELMHTSVAILLMEVRPNSSDDDDD